MSPEPIWPYAITKYAGELHCRMKQRMMTDDGSVIISPVFNTFGPYASAKAVIPKLMLNCLRGGQINTTEGEQRREFNYVSNVVDGLVQAATRRGPVNGPVNIVLILGGPSPHAVQGTQVVRPRNHYPHDWLKLEPVRLAEG